MAKPLTTIHVIMTGGTIDSFYDGSIDTVRPYSHSIIPNFLEGLKIQGINFEFTEICMKDSRELNENDLKNILKAVADSKHKKIIITHGTYTMPDTARFLKQMLKRKDQSILLTGSMVPLQGITPSDAPFNLGFSIAEIQHLKEGIWVCMNGNIFDPEEIFKMLNGGKFISIFGVI